jgi:hypothetical protein
MRKGGFKGSIGAEEREACEVERYQSSRAAVTYEEWQRSVL